MEKLFESGLSQIHIIVIYSSEWINFILFPKILTIHRLWQREIGFVFVYIIENSVRISVVQNEVVWITMLKHWMIQFSSHSIKFYFWIIIAVVKDVEKQSCHCFRESVPVYHQKSCLSTLIYGKSSVLLQRLWNNNNHRLHCYPHGAIIRTVKEDEKFHSRNLMAPNTNRALYHVPCTHTQINKKIT